MDIVAALKAENIRVSNVNKWLFWDVGSREWTVVEKKFAARGVTVLYSGDNEEKAVRVLLENK